MQYSTRLIWTVDKGLHYADKDELAADIKRYAKKADAAPPGSSDRVRYTHKAVKLARELGRLNAQEK